MKKLLLLISCIGFVVGAKATHVMSAQITYKYVSSGKYDVTVKVYRDCNGIALSNSPIQARAKTGSGSASFTIPLVSVTDVTGILAKCSLNSKCSGSYQYGIEEHVFSGQIDLSSFSSCEIILSWEQCCRNSVISTGAADANYYVETALNKCLVNSSPDFVGLPTFLLAKGEDYAIANTAVDPDGDILTYELTDPLQGAGSPISYASSWSAKKPITFNGFPNASLPLPSGFHFDSVTSNMFFRPTVANQVTVVVLKVSEWRVISGVLTKIGQVMRDIQILVYNGSGNKLPQFNGIDPAVPICNSAGNYCFDVYITDADSADTLSYSYKTNIPGATFTNIGTQPNKPVVQVCFAVDSAMLATDITKFQFTIFAKDNECPLPGKNEKTYYLKLGDILPDSFDIVKNLSCRNFTFVLNNRSSKPLPTLEWTFSNADTTIITNSDTLTGTITDTGWHYISVSLGAGCRTYADSFYVPAALFFSATLGADTTHCWADTLTIVPQKTGGFGPFKYEWMNGDSTPTLNWSYDSTGTHTVWVKITDANNCVVIDSAEYTTYRPEVVLNASANKICFGDSVVLTANIQHTDTTNGTYGWRGFAQKHLQVTAFPVGLVMYEFEYADSLGCPAYASTSIEVANLSANITQPDTICKGDTAVFFATISSRGQQWLPLWDSTYTGNTYKVPTASLAYGTHTVQLTYSDSGMCAVNQNLTFVVDSNPNITFGIPQIICENAAAFTLQVSPSGGTWSGNGITGNTFNPGSASPGWHNLVYSYSSAACSATDSLSIRVLQQPVASFTVDKYIAVFNDTFHFTNTSVADTVLAYQWTFGDLNTSMLTSPEHKYADTGVYLVTLWVNNGACAPDSATAIVKVGSHYLSVAEINGSGIQLYPNPATSAFTVASETSIATITLTDITGRRVLFEEINSSNATVNVSGLNTGIYMVHITDVNNRVYSAKLVVER